MVERSFRNRLFINIGIGVGIIILLSLFIILLNIDINKRVEAIDAVKVELALRNRTIELLTGANSDLKKAAPLFVQMQQVLPNRDQLINFPRELNRQAENYGVDIGFSFGSEQSGVKGEPGSIKFMMTIDGSYDNILDFLRYVEQHRYFISIASVDVRRTSPGKFSLQTSGDIYTK